MNDISKIFETAIKNRISYNRSLVLKKIEEVPNIWCRIEDDSRRMWYLISLSNGKTVIEEYGYLSYCFPVALIKDNCPQNICAILCKYNILCEKMYDSFSCDPKVLEHYIDTQEIELIDDRFLHDDSIPFAQEIFLKIDEGLNYINPYNFTFEDIK